MWSRGDPLFSAAPQDLDVPNALTSEVRTQPPVAEASRFGRQPVVAARPLREQRGCREEPSVGAWKSGATLRAVCGRLGQARHRLDDSGASELGD